MLIVVLAIVWFDFFPSKVVIQEARSHSDSIASILEEMKSDPDGNGCSGGGGIEVTTGIPVAVSSLGSDPKKTTIKRVAAPASTVILPNKRSRNIIFAGNTLPQGAIPIQVRYRCCRLIEK